MYTANFPNCVDSFFSLDAERAQRLHAVLFHTLCEPYRAALFNLSALIGSFFILEEFLPYPSQQNKTLTGVLVKIETSFYI